MSNRIHLTSLSVSVCFSSFRFSQYLLYFAPNLCLDGWRTLVAFHQQFSVIRGLKRSPWRASARRARSTYRGS